MTGQDIGPFDGKLSNGTGEGNYTLAFVDAQVSPDHFDNLHEVTVSRDGQPDLHLAGKGIAKFNPDTAGKLTTGTLALRPR